VPGAPSSRVAHARLTSYAAVPRRSLGAARA
jgi:hypothetical protein